MAEAKPTPTTHEAGSDQVGVRAGRSDQTLENADQRDWRIEDFIRRLRERKETVQFFDLTLDSLLERVTLPEKDVPILVEMM